MRLPAVAKLLSALFVFAVSASGSSRSDDGQIELRLRTRIQPFHGEGPWVDADFKQNLVIPETAIIITDMWDKHWCSGATRRVGQIAQRMEPLLNKARDAGILIVHAPSETMAFYANSPGRLLAKNAPPSIPPSEILLREAPLPIDDSDGGCDTPGDKFYTAWSRENSALTIGPGDVISDSGTEIYNVLKQRHINTVLFMGVHANMCILNRTFGIRQLSKWGLRCVLVRDLTDAMYNPASKPFVSHTAGTELVIEHIEKYWAPTVTSDGLLAALKGDRSQ
jgi:nicotinamidase-related amidase